MAEPRGNPDPRPRRALVVGRFQPPHRGHLEVLREAASAAAEVIVVVGSAQRSHTPANPLTAGERVEALTGLVRDSGLDLDMAYTVPVPDLDQYHLWVAHVAAHVPAFDVVVAANPMTLYLFSKAGYEVHKVDPVKRDQWSGTEIRRRLMAGEDVGDAVTQSVARLLARGEIHSRFRSIAAQKEGTPR